MWPGDEVVRWQVSVPHLSQEADLSLALLAGVRASSTELRVGSGATPAGAGRGAGAWAGAGPGACAGGQVQVHVQ